MNFIKFEESAIVDCKLIECDMCNDIKIGKKLSTQEFLRELAETGWTASADGLIMCKRCAQKRIKG